MFELYLDSADCAAIKSLADALPLAGITTNPSILATSNRGLLDFLKRGTEILGQDSRFHVQVISNKVDKIVAEAEHLHALPYNIVIKIPAHAEGLSAIKQIKQRNIPVLATAIYNVQQGWLAALNGADYLAPYLNRMDNLGFDGIGVVSDLQHLINQYQLPSKLLVASFKNVNQVLQVLKCGVSAVTLPIDIAQHMLNHAEANAAVQKFEQDWQSVFATKLSFET